MKRYIMISVLFIIAIVLVYLFGRKTDYIKTGKLYINEIMASNSYTVKDSDGNYSDYIEIYNGYNYDINLEGYYLTDSIVDMKKWRFPSITIKEHEYLIIYASSLNKCDSSCHTNFKLNSEGETISLIDKTGNIISKVTYPKLNNDVSYSLVKREYKITKPTPGKENNSDVIKEVDISNYKIIINEYLSHNKGISNASDGGYYDFVELYNNGDDVNLSGLSLSDDSKNLNKFILPEKELKAHEYIVIYLTGGEVVDGIYANFKLSDNDDKIILSSNGKIIDEVNVVKLDKNMSYGKIENKWVYFLTPTPGYENNTHYIEMWGAQ